LRRILSAKVLKTNCIVHHRKKDPRDRVALASHALASTLAGQQQSRSGDVDTQRHLLHRNEPHFANEKITSTLLRDVHKNWVEVFDRTKGKLKEGPARTSAAIVIADYERTRFEVTETLN
jgi:hypothetical protein